MPPLDLLIFLFSVQATIAAPIIAERADVDTFVFDGDAPWSLNASDLASVLYCPNGNPTAQLPPVLLVHGTASNGLESWGDGFVPALKADGFTACYISVPHRSMGDIQSNAQYVAYNLHQLSKLSGNLPVAVVSHSQGGPMTQWAMQFWPSTKKVTRMFIPIAPDFHGVEVMNSDSIFSGVCASGVCQAALWQQDSRSNFYKALHRSGFEAKVPTTSIWTEYDGVVTPPDKNADLPGATVISVQQLCPLRPSNHMTMTIGAAPYALALDALKNNGKASLARVRWSAWNICLRVTAPGMNVDMANDLNKILGQVIYGMIMETPRMTNEPETADYAKEKA